MTRVPNLSLLPPSTMRLSSIAAVLSLLTVSGVVASPVLASDDQVALAVDAPVRTMDKWEYEDCGKRQCS